MFSRIPLLSQRGMRGTLPSRRCTYDNPANNNKHITVPTTFQMFPPASTVDNLVYTKLARTRDEATKKNFSLQIQDKIILLKNPVAFRVRQHQPLTVTSSDLYLSALIQQQQHIVRALLQLKLLCTLLCVYNLYVPLPLAYTRPTILKRVE